VWIVFLRFQPIQCVCTSSLMLTLSNTDVTGIDLHHTGFEQIYLDLLITFSLFLFDFT